tara:strand:- start:517 stop:909 length:393 start_codon:yes stop_codon:yes gene_type:complete
MFDNKKPTVCMIGRWQPWHEGHTELFKKALTITGQVVIMIRDVEGVDAGMGNTDNPFNVEDIWTKIEMALAQHDFIFGVEFKIMTVPNIVDISYGRGVGYTFTEHDLGKDIHEISATKIRKQMRKDGKLA